MELQTHLNQVILQRSRLLPAALNVRVDAQDHDQTNAMSVNTSEGAPIMSVLPIASGQNTKMWLENSASLVVAHVNLVMDPVQLIVCLVIHLSFSTMEAV